MDYFFTFGQSHWHRYGMPMKDLWVRVTAKTYMAARMIFINQWSSQYMEKPDKWAFQYEEKDFNRRFFPGGEFEHLTEKI